jgi:hypothetical protein
MKILRSVTRRGFTVRTAGWFTVTSPNKWFAASQFREGFPSIVSQSQGTAAPAAAEPKAIGRAGVQETTAPPQILVPGTQDHRLMIRALAALTAIAITFLMLWWMGRP